MDKREVKSLSGELQGWGGGLLVLGVMHFFIKALAAEWGVVLVALGLGAMLIRHRGMFIAIGGALMLIGVVNFIGSFHGGPGFWTAFGCMQVYWGVKEMAKFGKYASSLAETVSPAEATMLEEQ